MSKDVVVLKVDLVVAPAVIELEKYAMVNDYLIHELKGFKKYLEKRKLYDFEDEHFTFALSTLVERIGTLLSNCLGSAFFERGYVCASLSTGSIMLTADLAPTAEHARINTLSTSVH